MSNLFTSCDFIHAALFHCVYIMLKCPILYHYYIFCFYYRVNILEIAAERERDKHYFSYLLYYKYGQHNCFQQTNRQQKPTSNNFHLYVKRTHLS